MERVVPSLPRWRPKARARVSALTMARLSSDVRLKTEFGSAEVSTPPASLKSADPRHKGTFGRYLRLAREEAPFILGSIACVAVYSSATLAIPRGFGALIDHAGRGEMPWAVGSRLLMWFNVAAAGNFGRLAFVGVAGERAVAKLRVRVFQSIARQPAAFFDSSDHRTGALTQRLSLDTNVVGASLTEGLSAGAKNLAQAFGSLGVMLYFSPTLTGCIVCLLPPVAVLAGRYGKYVRKLQGLQQDALASMGVVAEERLANIRTVKAFGREAEEGAWFNSKVHRVFELARSMLLWNASYVAFLHWSGYMVLYGVVGCGASLVTAHDMTAGTLFSFMLYTIYCGIGITGVMNLATDLNKGYGASIRLFDIIDKADAIDETESQRLTTRLLQCKGKFAFDHVGFAYPARPEVTVYKDLSLAVDPGKCTAVVGASGGGKSTLALLLLKLYEPTNGTVTLDGQALSGLDTAWLRSLVGFVPQEPVLFGGTVAQNIAYGVSKNTTWECPLDPCTKEAVVAAAKKANAHDFICALPNQYDTYVGEGGRSLSGGQKQRLAIARALIRKPQLLILDEATSALDAESEVVVQEALEKLIQDARVDQSRGVLVFAHRLSMIRQADHVAVMKDGAVVDEGPYEHVRRNPYFRQLVGVVAEEENHVAE